MRTLASVPLFGLVTFLTGGCDPPSAPIVNAPSPRPVSAETSIEAAPLVESVSSVAPSSEPLPIHLSAGVALPQLLPEGTQIGVSVDYKISGSLKSSRYVLVLESSGGVITMPVQLSPVGGTLQGFFGPSVRPEHQPFRARIDVIPATGNRSPASNTTSLQASY